MGLKIRYGVDISLINNSGSTPNNNTHDTCRIDLIIGIGHHDNINKAKDLISDILSNEILILSNPASTIMVIDFDENSINLAVRPWVNTIDFCEAGLSLLQSIKETFEKNGISTPFPQRDLNIVRTDQIKQAPVYKTLY